MQHLCFSLILPVWMVVFHPFFISLTEMRYSTASGKMGISQKIFWDDLEVGLSNHFKEKVDFLHPKDKARHARQVKEYLLKHNQILVNGKPLSLNLLGYEVDGEAAWFYLESTPVELPKSVEVTNTLLLSDRPGQQNIVHIYNQSKSPRSLLLSEGNEKGRIEF